jgi:hypothetical protein
MRRRSVRSSINDTPTDRRREPASVEGAEQHPPIDGFISGGVIKIRLRRSMVIRQQGGGAAGATDTGSDHEDLTVRAFAIGAKDFNEIL